MTRSPDLTPAELRVMKALWELERGSVAEVRAELAQARPGARVHDGDDAARPARRQGRGASSTRRASRSSTGPAHRRESVLRERLREFVREVFDGQADSLVLDLVEDETLSRAELRAIERQIAEAEKAPTEEGRKQVTSSSRRCTAKAWRSTLA